MKMFLLGMVCYWVFNFIMLLICDLLIHNFDEDNIIVVIAGPIYWLYGLILCYIVKPILKSRRAYKYRGIIRVDGRLYQISSEDYCKLMYSDDERCHSFIMRLPMEDRKKLFEQEGWKEEWWNPDYINVGCCSLRYAPKKAWSKYPKYKGEIK